MKLRKRISIILIINILVLSLSTGFFVVSAKALDIPATIQSAKQAHDAVVSYLADEVSVPNSEANNYVKKLLAPLGFVVGYVVFPVSSKTIPP